MKFSLIFLFLISAFFSFSQNRLQNLGANINTGLSEIGPILSPDGKNLYFSREVPGDPNHLNRDIWASSLQANKMWSVARRIDNILNNQGWNSICGISADGNTILLAGVYMPDGTLRGGFSISRRSANGWTTPFALNIPGIPLSYETQTASMSPDGKIIIFSSNCVIDKKFYGSFDLYVTILKDNGEWTVPINLGENVNTSGYEISPFLAADGVTLYFSSDGLAGFGGNDIYMVRRQDDTWANWSKPVNLGKEVNTKLWESYITVSASGEYAYVGSTANSLGGMDLFRVKLTKEMKPLNDTLLSVKEVGRHYKIVALDSVLNEEAKNKLVQSEKKNQEIIAEKLRKKAKAQKDSLDKIKLEKINKYKYDSISAIKIKLKMRQDSLLQVHQKLLEKMNQDSLVALKIRKKEKMRQDSLQYVFLKNKEIAKQDSLQKIRIIQKEKQLQDSLYQIEIKRKAIAYLDSLRTLETTKEKGMLTQPEIATSIAISAKKEEKQVQELKFSSIPENLGNFVNTGLSEMAPLISADGQTLFFSRSVANDYKNRIRRIYCSKLINGNKWGEAVDLGDKININAWNMACGITPDGNTLLLSGAYQPNGILKGGFSISQKNSNGWSTPKPLNICNYPIQEETQSGSLAATGNAIVFSSYNSMGEEFYGTTDLFVTFLQEDSSWSCPINLGSTINTVDYETSPFLAADGVSLYFSSDGHGGYGSQDIFVSRRLDDTWKNWTIPENLGSKVNSKDWESFFSISASGEYAYVGSLRNTHGMMDIFRIKIDNYVKPKPMILISGKVINSTTGKPLSAKISYKSLNDSSVTGNALTNPQSGEYKIILKAGAVYGFSAKADSFYGVNESINLVNLEEYQEIVKNLELKPVGVGEVFRLNNLFFKQGEAILLAESFVELDGLVKMLQKNSTMVIEIGGHTEAGHSDKKLSQDRAENVRDYLISKGISSNRIKAVGYGNTKPVVRSNNVEVQYLNRRVEFKILAK